MNASPKARDMRLDALRGMFLVIMAGVHVPSPLSHLLQEPFGFTSAAEGFIFLSACLAGMVYGKTYLNNGWTEMSRRVWSRAKLVYVVHLAVLLPVALIAWIYARQVAPLANHFHDFLQHPFESLLLIPLLLHQAPLFDILPLYVVLLLATPIAFATARWQGWGVVLSISFIGWLAAQFPATHLAPDALLPVRGGSFNLLAWQFLWFCGVALGETSLHGKIISQKFRAFTATLAAFVVLFGLCARHGALPGVTINSEVYFWMDKWTLGPLRLLNFAAWVVFLLSWNPRPPAWLMEQTALWGRHSLAVFALHLPLVVCAASVIQMFSMNGVEETFLGLSVIAGISLWVTWLEINSRQRKQFPAVPAETQPKLHRLLNREIIRTAPPKPTAG
ncbi:MAG: OpgC domain-containing protein [Verrucomicrobiota bacterium]